MKMAPEGVGVIQLFKLLRTPGKRDKRAFEGQVQEGSQKKEKKNFLEKVRPIKWALFDASWKPDTSLGSAKKRSWSIMEKKRSLAKITYPIPKACKKRVLGKVCKE